MTMLLYRFVELGVLQIYIHLIDGDRFRSANRAIMSIDSNFALDYVK